MMQKVFYGNEALVVEQAVDSKMNTNVALGILVILILWFGVYPQPMLQLTNDTAKAVLAAVGK